MLMPAIFGSNLFDGWMDDEFRDLDKMDREMNKKLYGHEAGHVMKTDVRELADHYEVDIDLPGFKKNEISAKLENGYLTVSAAKKHDNDEKDKAGRYIRRERYSGSVSRTFYVGDEIKQQDIHGKFEDGILCLCIPKKDAKTIEENKYISIE